MGLFFATALQTLMVFTFVYILTPFRLSVKKLLPILGGIVCVLCLVAGWLAREYGLAFIASWGFLFISLPAFLSAYLLSSARGVRYVFVVLTALVFHQMLSTLMMAFRISQGGYTPAYFVLNILSFGVLIAGGYVLRKDFHKIIFTYRAEFCCLNPILLLLLGLIYLFSPIVDASVLDTDLLLMAVVLDLLILLFYVYLGINFHSLSKHCDNARDTLSLKLQVEEAQTHIALLQASQEKTSYYRHDLRHHISLIHMFLENGELGKLRTYLDDVKKSIDSDTPQRYCQNEAVNLLLASFDAKAKESGVRLLADLQVPHSLQISNPELCTLLSNALENAITAAAQSHEGTEKTVRLMIRLTNGKLLICVENPYAGEVHIENGLPQTACTGHGFGVKSMVAIVEKYGGLFSFDAVHGTFTLRFVV